MFGWGKTSRPDRVTGNRLIVERAAKGSVAAGLAIFSVVAVAAVSDIDPGALFYDGVEAVEVAHVDPTPVRRTVKPQAVAAVRVINSGTVDEDPARHAAAVAALEQAASNPATAAASDDDDLTPTGGYADWYPAKSKTFRTVCVRLCDGALTPISFATTHERLALDALRCRKSCGTPSKLYIQANPASDTDKLVDLDGKPYGELATAFKFRTSYDAACTCRPHAWQSIAQARHRIFEIQARLRRGRELVLDRFTKVKVAASKGARIARIGSRSNSALVSGSLVSGSTVARPDAPPGLRVSAATSGQTETSAVGEPDTIISAPAKPVRKAAGKRKGKAIALARDTALARDKAQRAKSANNAVLLVLFGTAPAADVPTPGKLTPAIRPLNSLVRADASARRYDGNDWRISSYEPL